MLSPILGHPQVTINSDGGQPHPSAILDIQSTSRGLLPPRMTFSQLNAIQDPADGLMVFCTNCGTNGSGSLAGFINGIWHLFSLGCTIPPSPLAGNLVPSVDQIIWNWRSVPGAIGYKWSPDNDFSTATDVGTDTTMTETGLICSTAYTRYVWAYNDCGNDVPCALQQTTSACQGFTCGQPFTDSRDGKTYGTVAIGAQCWMAQNLNTGTMINNAVNQTDNGAIEKYCFNNMESNCDVYGGLYQWNEAMYYINTEGWQGICPAGWHFPSNGEWVELMNFLGGSVVAGGKMKETGFTHWYSPNTGATNESGFTGLGGGLRAVDASFISQFVYVFFWTSTQATDPTDAFNYSLSCFHTVLFPNDHYHKPSGFSIRCVHGENCAGPASPAEGSHTKTQYTITWNWAQADKAMGYKWNTVDDYASAADMGTLTTKTETGLTPETSYTRYVWAYNVCGVSEKRVLTSQTNGIHYVGQNFGGGVVFYVDDIGEHGLVAAPYDQGSAKWGCYTHLIGGTTTLFGSGQYNTNIILIGCNQSGIPARVCNDLVLNGYDDWFLPSLDELNEMYLHESEIGGFTNNSYWSSSEYNYLNSWQISFFTGVGGWSSKESLFYIRAIRDF